MAMQNSTCLHSAMLNESPQSKKTGLMQLPVELLMGILGHLDNDTTRYGIRPVNARFLLLTSDFSLNRRVRVPEYWPRERVPALLSTEPLQYHLQELELRRDDDLQKVYEFFHNQHLTLAVLTRIICDIDTVLSESELGHSVLSLVTPSLVRFDIRKSYGNSCSISQLDRLFSATSTMNTLITAFPQLQIHLDASSSEDDLNSDMFSMLKLHSGQLHGTLAISNNGIFKIPFDLLEECGLMDQLHPNNELFHNALRRNATCVELDTEKQLLYAMLGLEHATNLSITVGGESQQAHPMKTSGTTLQLKSFTFNERYEQPDVVIETKYYDNVIVKHCSSLVELKLSRCFITNTLLNVLPVTLRHLTLELCEYQAAGVAGELQLDLLSLEISYSHTSKLLAAVRDRLPMQSRMRCLCLEEYSGDQHMIDSLLRRCEMLMTVQLDYKCGQDDAQLIFPSTVEDVAIRFELDTISELLMSLKVLDRLLGSPALKKLAVRVLCNSNLPRQLWFEAEVHRMLKNALNVLPRLANLFICILSEASLDAYQSISQMIENVLEEQCRPYWKHNDGYIMVPKHLLR